MSLRSINKIKHCRFIDLGIERDRNKGERKWMNFPFSDEIFGAVESTGLLNPVETPGHRGCEGSLGGRVWA